MIKEKLLKNNVFIINALRVFCILLCPYVHFYLPLKLLALIFLDNTHALDPYKCKRSNYNHIKFEKKNNVCLIRAETFVICSQQVHN